MGVTGDRSTVESPCRNPVAMDRQADIGCERKLTGVLQDIPSYLFVNLPGFGQRNVSRLHRLRVYWTLKIKGIIGNGYLPGVDEVETKQAEI